MNKKILFSGACILVKNYKQHLILLPESVKCYKNGKLVESAEVGSDLNDLVTFIVE